MFFSLSLDVLEHIENKMRGKTLKWWNDNATMEQYNKTDLPTANENRKTQQSKIAQSKSVKCWVGEWCLYLYMSVPGCVYELNEEEKWNQRSLILSLYLFQ